MKNLAITLCISLLFAGQVFAVIWKDDFERKELGDKWTPIACCNMPNLPNWKIENGVLKGHWPFWNGQMLFLEEFPFMDYTIQVKCRIDKIWIVPDFADAGIIFRSQDGPVKGIPLYGLGMGASRIQFGCLLEGNFQYLVPKPEKHNFGEWYTMKLVVMGDDFLGYVNDKPLCILNDGRFKGNFVGFWLGANIDASFDDFMITDQVDEDALLDFAVSSGDKVATTWAGLKVQ